MHSNRNHGIVLFFWGMAFFGLTYAASAQEARPAPSANSALGTAPDALPEAPTPQIELAAVAEPKAAQTQNAQPDAGNAVPAGSAEQNRSAQEPASKNDPAPTSGSGANGALTQNCSSSNSSPQQPCSKNSQRDKATEEVKEQEKQRVEGIVPDFNVTYHHDAAPLTAGQKMSLSFHSAVDPFAFASAFLESGYHEGLNDLTGFSWGAKGYFERTGAAYLDTFDGDILSTGIFPVIFRQDPRYFRLGHGATGHRILYSLATNFIAKNDYNGKWGPNYGNILGNMAAGALSNLYYPNSNIGFGLTMSNMAIQIAEGAGGSLFNEFWPDLARKYLHKDPTHGLDAQQAAEDKEKQSRETSPNVDKGNDSTNQK